MGLNKKEYLKHIIFFIILILSSIVFIVLPINNIIIKIYSWHIVQPEVTQGLLQIILCFAAFFFISYTESNKHKLICISIMLFLYLQANQVFFAFVIIWIYFEVIIQIGNIIKELFFREKNKKIEDYLSSFLIGFIIWSAIAILCSLLNFGSNANLRIITIILFLLCGISKIFFKDKKFLITKLMNNFLMLKKTQIFYCIGIAFLIAIQCVKGSKGPEYDSLWYGLFSDRRLFGIGSFFESFGLMRFVNYYPKLIELFSAPFGDLEILSLIYSINIIFYFFVLLVCFVIIKTFQLDVTKCLFLTFIIGTIPCLSNWATTAKTDVSTVFFLLLTTLYLIKFISYGDKASLYIAILACFPTVCLKMHGMFFLSSLLLGFILSLFFYIKSEKVHFLNKLVLKMHTKYFILIIIAFFVLFGIQYRTYKLTGLPMYPYFSSFWKNMGLTGIYPFENPNAFVNTTPKISNIFNVKFLIAHIYNMLFNPGGIREYIKITNFEMSWPGNIFAWFFITICIIVIFDYANARKLVYIYLKKMKYPFVILLPTIILGCVYAVFMYNQAYDGNYFNFPVVISIIFFGTILLKTSIGYVLFKNNEKRSLFINERIIFKTILFFLIFIQFIYMFISHGSWEPGTTTFKFNIFKPIFITRSIQSYCYLEQNGLLGIEEYLSTLENRNPRVLGLDDNKFLYFLSWRYEQFAPWEIDGIGDTQENLLKYLDWAKIDYILLPGTVVGKNILNDTTQMLMDNNKALQRKFGDYRLVSIKDDNFDIYIEEIIGFCNDN